MRLARVARALRLAAPLLAVCSLNACFTTHPVAPAPEPPATPLAVPPAAAAEITPAPKPRSRRGNPPYYDVFGKRYYVLSSGVGYVERGVASWYGPGFDKVPTSSGETYDMHAMSAAHRTLPLPAYVLVTNLQNGRNVVVRVNDRGPFVGNRIIDLSYSAAAKLDMLRNGTAMVEVRSIDPEFRAGSGVPLRPGAPQSTAPTIAAAAQSVPAAADAATQGSTPVNAPLFIQAGAFSDPANADRLVARLRGGDYGQVFVRADEIAGRKMYRVRIGPVRDVAEFDRVVAALERTGIHDAHLALD